jgi:N-acetylglucosaminyldiphosphoundecaprenol N-acetyl-beta-D-mannosaminyltransferase
VKQSPQELVEGEVRILGVKVTPITAALLLSRVADMIDNNHKGTVLPINVHFINLAWQHRWLRKFADSVEYVLCDGRGVLLASKVLGQQIPEQIRFLDWVHHLFALAQSRGYSLYLLGAEKTTIHKAATDLQKQYPDLRIVGVHEGYFEKTGAGNDRVIEDINRTHPDILLTGFSMPIEEKWLLENKERLYARLFILGAGCFEFLAGNVPTCPKWLSRVYLEWLFRLITEPSRLSKRYIVGNPLFAARILWAAVSHGFKPQGEKSGA